MVVEHTHKQTPRCIRVAELGSLLSGAKMAMKIFVNLQILLSKIKRHFFCAKISKNFVTRDKS